MAGLIASGLAVVGVGHTEGNFADTWRSWFKILLLELAAVAVKNSEGGYADSFSILLSVCSSGRPVACHGTAVADIRTHTGPAHGSLETKVSVMLERVYRSAILEAFRHASAYV